MTPKEKAREIFDKYWLFFVEDTDAMGIHKLTKKCALIAVDEILEMDLPILEEDADGFYDYWEQVKHEINSF